jgi:peptide/nickel transport system ATP-binding protein
MVEGGGREATMNNPYHSCMHLLLSDVPDPQSGLYPHKGVTARGEAPPLIDPQPARPFAPRCPKVMDMCRPSMPAPTAVHDDHWVACCLYFSRLLK